MSLELLMFNGQTINNGNTLIGYIPKDIPFLPEASPVFVQRSEQWPEYGGKRLNDSTLPIELVLRGALRSVQRDQLRQLFDTSVQQMGVLTARETLTGEEWMIEATPIRASYEKNKVTVILAVERPVWQSTSMKQVSQTLTASGQTITLMVGGNRDTLPIIEITPGGAKAGGFAYKRFITVTNPLDSGFVDLPFEFTNGGLNLTGKAQSSGNDVRLIIDDVEVDRWLDGAISAQRVWGLLNLKPRVEFLLSGGLTSGAVSEIAFQDSRTARKVIKALVAPGCLVIGSEVIGFLEKDEANLKVTGITRGAKETTPAAHAAGDVVRWLEHDIWQVYGNSSLGAQDTDNRKQPMLSLSSSSNTSWVFGLFSDLANMRSGRWMGSIISRRGKASRVYSGPLGSDADPASRMGMAILPWMNGNKSQSEDVILEWRFHHPAGITTVSSSGTKYRSAASWPAKTALQKSLDGVRWVDQWNLPTPTNPQTWEGWSKPGEALGASYPHLRVVMDGTAGAGAADYLEVSSLTITLNSTQVPQIMVGPELGNYDLDARITHLGHDEWIGIKRVMKVGQTLTVDCQTPTVLDGDGNEIIGARSLSSERQDWLRLSPGVNVLRVDDAGLSGLTVTVKWHDQRLGNG